VLCAALVTFSSASGYGTNACDAQKIAQENEANRLHREIVDNCASYDTQCVLDADLWLRNRLDEIVQEWFFCRESTAEVPAGSGWSNRIVKQWIGGCGR